MNLRCGAAVVAFLAGLLAANEGIAQESLIDMARRLAPGPVSIERMRELVPVPLERTLRGADVVVVGTVTELRTYLSVDEETLYTDYLVMPRRVMFAGVGPPASLPAVGQPVIVTRWGGELVIEGVPVSVRDRDALPLEKGADAVLCLVQEEKTGNYRLVNEIAANFPLRSGRIELPAEREAFGPGFDRIRGTSLDELEAIVRTREVREDAQ